MSTGTVHTMTPDGARRRRVELVESAGGDETALRARADVYALDARELAVLDEIDALDYLLDGASAG